MLQLLLAEVLIDFYKNIQRNQQTRLKLQKRGSELCSHHNISLPQNYFNLIKKNYIVEKQILTKQQSF